MSEQYGDAVVEAIQVLSEIVRECGLGDPDVKSVLRRCLYVAHLIGDAEYQELWDLHITGFPAGREVPRSRRIAGRVHWKSDKIDPNVHDYLGDKADQEYGIPSSPVYEARLSIEQLERRAISGLVRLSTEIEQKTIRVERQTHSTYPSRYHEYVDVYPWDVYPATNFKYALGKIRSEAFTWAMTTVVRLKYQNRIATIWDKYRTEVDGALAKMSLTNHLTALDRQIGSDNEQEWRAALYSCRNMLRDVADYLWLVPGKTVPLPNRDGRMVDAPVNKERYITRLNAYLFYKRRGTDETRLSRTEAELLGELIGRVNTLDNNAHEKTDRNLAEAAALHTYMVISNLIRLTDMEPLIELPPE